MYYIQEKEEEEEEYILYNVYIYLSRHMFEDKFQLDAFDLLAALIFYLEHMN